MARGYGASGAGAGAAAAVRDAIGMFMGLRDKRLERERQAEIDARNAAQQALQIDELRQRMSQQLTESRDKRVRELLEGITEPTAVDRSTFEDVQQSTFRPFSYEAAPMLSYEGKPQTAGGPMVRPYIPPSTQAAMLRAEAQAQHYQNQLSNYQSLDRYRDAMAQAATDRAQTAEGNLRVREQLAGLQMMLGPFLANVQAGRGRTDIAEGVARIRKERAANILGPHLHPGGQEGYDADTEKQVEDFISGAAPDPTEGPLDLPGMRFKTSIPELFEQQDIQDQIEKSQRGKIRPGQKEQPKKRFQILDVK